MKERSHLTNLPEFWAALLGPIFTSVLFSFLIALRAQLAVDLSYEGLNSLLTIFKLPLGLAALAFPLVALVASNHRSRQTAEQIRVAGEQNVFSNYFRHRDAFFDVLEKLESELEVQFSDRSGLYRKLFPLNTPARLEIHLPGEAEGKIYLEGIAERYNAAIALAHENEGFDVEDCKNFFLEIFLVSLKLKFFSKDGIYINWYKSFDITAERRWRIAFEEGNELKHASATASVIQALGDFCHLKLKVDDPEPTISFASVASNAFGELVN